MQVWRIARRVYPPLDGTGARLNGKRWNPQGTPVVYTASHLSLAVLELLVHIDPEDIPDDLTAYRIGIPDALEIESVRNLPEDWKTNLAACRTAGEAWFRSGRTAVLSVPSAVIEQERNMVLNPVHPAFPEIQILEELSFQFDPRLPGFRTGS
jgi:RES domain-containing protein